MTAGETCERCGLRYEELATGLTYREILGMLWSSDDDPATWRHKRRGTVLGMWRQTKLELWAEHLATCDGNAAINLKAYRIAFDGITAYFAAPRRARAKYLAARTISEVYELSIGEAFKAMHCRRAPRGDAEAIALGHEGGIPNYSPIYRDAMKRENVAPYAVPAFILYVGPGSDEIEIVRNPFCVKRRKDQ